MKIFNEKTETTTVHVSSNCIWTTQLTIVYRTIFGIKVWKINSKEQACKYGIPYVATL